MRQKETHLLGKLDRKSVGSKSIFCQNCIHWVYKRCSKIRARFKIDPSFKCNACTNNIITISQDDPEVIIGNDKFEMVDSFCYLGDSIGQSGSCFEGTTETLNAAWKNCQFTSSTDKKWYLAES